MSALERKMKSLALQMARLEAIAEFLNKHAGVAEECKLKKMSTGTGLYFEDKAYIRPVGDMPVELQLQRHIEDWNAPNADANRVICQDVSGLSTLQFAAMLKKAKIRLAKTVTTRVPA